MEDFDIDMTLGAEYENLSVIRGVVRTYFEIEKISEEDKVHLIAVIDELSTNAIEHAYKNEFQNLTKEEKKIRVALELRDEILKAEIEDYGQGYKSNGKSKEEGGMGLSIVKGFVDNFFLENKEKGCKIIISKKIKKEEE